MDNPAIFNGIVIREVSGTDLNAVPVARLESTAEEVATRLAYRAERRINSIRAIADVLEAGVSLNPVETAVQCLEALEDLGWSDYE